MPVLTWLTREHDLKSAQNAPYRLLEESPEFSAGEATTENMLIQGDNLDALKALLPYYAGQVKCIYIDPPYNTRSAFEHYDDNLEHSQWLAMIYPRLELLRELLAEDGSIWVSIDDNEGHYLKVIMDEVFGRRNFIASNVWQKRYSRENREAIGDVHEYIVLYAKNPEKFKSLRNLLPIGDKQQKLYKNPNKDPRGLWQSVSLLAQGYRPNQMYEIVAPNGNVHVPPPGNCWKVIRSEYDKLIGDSRVYFGKDGKGVPRRMEFLDNAKGLVPWTWWPHEETGHTDESKKECNVLFGADVSFGTPKPERLIQRILQIATNPNDLVLDSFLGSGTTAAVAHKMGRRYIGIETYLEQDFPVVLWLVPTNTIRSQTLDALKQPKHPYRETIDKAFDGRVAVFDIADIESIRPQDLTERVCVIVGTLATLRVDKTEGRRIYSHNENYEPHFSRVSSNTPGLERVEEGPDKGQIKFSFANLLHLHKPLVIMDEAHNARTSLTFEVLQRISPACIVEFTATPDSTRSSGSNVICRVSAAELKGEEMIKLPIILKEHKNWQEAVRDAVLTRKRLEELAVVDTDFIRPIALIQAESKDRDVTVEVVLKHLLENELIPRERIAIATGNQRELDGIDLFDRNCKVEYVITVEALKEGWDCSFAYVFCSAANIHSGKDVEQLLGRVLRMPYAQRRTQEELNRAYAFVTSPNFAHAANDLHDRLVSMGFEEEEASEFIQAAQQPLIPEDDLPLWGHREPDPLVVACGEEYKFDWIEQEAPQGVALERGVDGELKLTVTGAISEELEEKIVAAAPRATQAELRKTIVSHRRYVQKSLSPSERGEHFSAPRLCVAIQGELELAEKELFLDARGWSLLDFPHALTPAEIAVDEGARTFEFDIRGKKVVFGLLGQEQQLDLSHVNTDWSEAELVRWLDKAARQPDVRQEVMLEFLRRTVADLRERLRLEMALLVRSRFILAKLLVEKIKGFRQEACAHGFQDTLFGPQAMVETSFEYAFNYDPNIYPANWYYQGRFDLSKKHYYPLIGEMKSKGEEFECACAIAALKGVKQWVRNLAVQPRASFWLPTATDRFYPDFVAELHDGRILVVEYKGEGYKTNDDSKEKCQIGQLWEEKSNGRGLFIMAVERDAQGRDVHRQLAEKIRQGKEYIV